MSNDTIPPIGENDSVKVAISDLRKANAKLVELKYEKEKNNKYREIIENDSIVVSELSSEIIKLKENYDKDTKALKRERNILGAVGLGTTICLIISLFK